MKENILKIETIQGLNSGEASCCYERGNIFTSLKIKGKELLYLDEETFINPEVNVRGGIPILFPNAGALEDNAIFPDLPQHGFARNLKWTNESSENEIKGSLVSNEKTFKVYPFDFKITILGKFEDDGSFTVTQEVENKGDGKGMPISDGLHPYFKVPHEQKENIKFNFEGGKYIEDSINEWGLGKYISIDNPKLKDPNFVMEIQIPSLGVIVIDASPEYQKIWVWSLPDKDFICIEPVMRNLNGLIDEPFIIKPKEVFKAVVNFNLK